MTLANQHHDEESSSKQPLNDSVSTSSSSPLSPRRATLSALIKLRNKRLLTKSQPPTPENKKHRPNTANSFDHDTRTQFQPAHETMEHRHKIRPVQLFVPSHSNPEALRLNKKALNAVLNRSAIANRKVVVFSVVGAFRKGKSFLLNFFLEYLYILQYSQKEFRNNTEMEWLHDETVLEGFHKSNPKKPNERPKRDTAGIWLWGEAIMIDAANGDRYAVLLCDLCGNGFTTNRRKEGHKASCACDVLSTEDNIIELYKEHPDFFIDCSTETKQLIEKLPGILGRLGAESFTYLKKLTNNVTSQYKAGD